MTHPRSDEQRRRRRFDSALLAAQSLNKEVNT
jgi:hypothetical protein